MQESDIKIFKELNNAISDYHIKLKIQYYDKSPFSEKDKKVIPIIIHYADKLENYKSKIFLLSTLGVLEFDEAVPYLINQYKVFSTNINSNPFDEILLLDLCDTLAKIRSINYIDLYLEILKLPPTAALEPIIKMFDKFNNLEIEKCVVELVEKENKIPTAWVGTLNETDKYWCSQKALEYVIRKKDIKYKTLIEKFLQPERLAWIWFSDSSFKKKNYSSCYKQYVAIAKKGLKYLECNNENLKTE